MSLQFILGSSGAGKSHYLFTDIINESINNPDKNYIVVVPEQYTMSTQHRLCSMHPRKGMLTIDVVSFERLAYKVFEEVGQEEKCVLDDTGKNLVIRRLLEQNKNKLKFFGSNISNTGFVSEMKSVISEMLQYDISCDKLEKIIENVDNDDALRLKLQDILLVYSSFKEYISREYVTKEEILEVLCRKIIYSQRIKNSIIVFDGFTGFTPVQYNLLSIILKMCEKVKITLTIDSREKYNVSEGMENLFFMSKETISKLHKICDTEHVQVLEPVFISFSDKSRFNKSEELLYLESNLLRNHFEKYNKPTDDIKIYSASVPKEEVLYVTGEILKLTRLEGYRYKDIAVVTSDLNSYGKMAANIFSENEIPYFLDYKRHVSDNPVIVAIEGVLEIMEKNYSYESVFGYLRTGMTDLLREDIDELDNYCIAVGIKGSRQWHKEWIRRFKRNKNNTDLEKLNSLRERVIGNIDTLSAKISASGGRVSDITRALYEYIVDMEFERKIGELAERDDTSDEYNQLYAKIIDVLDKMVELLGDESVTVTEYRKILTSGFDEIKIGLIPQTRDSVVIGDIERTRLDDIKVLFFIGVNDGNVPKMNNSRSILSETDRNSLEEMQVVLSPNVRQSAFTQRFYLYLIMTKMSEKLYLTYSNAQLDGKALYPSYIIKYAMKMFPYISVITKENVLQQMGYLRISKSDICWRSDCRRRIDGNIISRLIGNELVGSVTSFETYASCHYAYFLRNILRLKEREEHSFEKSDFGTILHSVIEEVCSRIKNSKKSFLLISEDERWEFVNASVDAICSDYGNTILKENKRNEFMIDRIRQFAYKTVWAIGDQLKNGVFAPDEFETGFIEDFGKIADTHYSMLGKIDRIDVCEDEENVYVKVVDYKTGTSDFDLLRTYYGLNLQLVSYLKAAMRLEEKKHTGKKAVPAAILYYNIDDPIVEWNSDEDKILNDIRKELRTKGVLNKNTDIINKMDDFITTSLCIPATKKKDGELSMSSTKAYTTEQFHQLMAYVDKKELDSVKNILSGKIDINPFAGGKIESCTYCDYKSVCGFSMDKDRDASREIFNIDNDTIWNNIQNGVDENGSILD